MLCLSSASFFLVIRRSGSDISYESESREPTNGGQRGAPTTGHTGAEADDDDFDFYG